MADLRCGHGQHVRHQPPMISRPWVLTEEGRQAFLGTQLNCKKCEEEVRPEIAVLQGFVPSLGAADER